MTYFISNTNIMARNISGKNDKFVILSPNREINPLKPGVQKKQIHSQTKMQLLGMYDI